MCNNAGAIIGGVVGFFVGGPAGAAIGAGLGHTSDASTQAAKAASSAQQSQASSAAAAGAATNLPVADANLTAGESASKGVQQRGEARKRLKAASLLATSGQGDLTAPVTGQPVAKPTLGS